jgi:hypothetical protein
MFNPSNLTQLDTDIRMISSHNDEAMILFWTIDHLLTSFRWQLP